VKEDFHVGTDETCVRPPHQCLTLSQETASIQWITRRQNARDCVSPAHIRLKAEELYFTRAQAELAAFDDWWIGSKTRHPAKFAIQSRLSLEMKRTCVGGMDVCLYDASIMAAFRAMRPCDQMLSMDESGRSVRPDKGKKKQCVYNVESGIEPRFREESGISQVTLVGPLNLSGPSLPPLILTAADIR
jgi:hypothetical protein